MLAMVRFRTPPARRACPLIFFILVAAGVGAAAGGCGSKWPTTSLTMAECVTVGTVAPASAWDTRKALARKGIAAYFDGADYPHDYRVLVPPADRERAVAVLRDLDQRPFYLVTPDGHTPDFHTPVGNTPYRGSRDPRGRAAPEYLEFSRPGRTGAG